MQDITITNNGKLQPAASVTLTMQDLAVIYDALHGHLHVAEHAIACPDPDCSVANEDDLPLEERVIDLSTTATLFGQVDATAEMLSSTITAWNITRAKNVTNAEFAKIVKSEEEATTDE